MGKQLQNISVFQQQQQVQEIWKFIRFQEEEEEKKDQIASVSEGSDKMTGLLEEVRKCFKRLTVLWHKNIKSTILGILFANDFILKLDIRNRAVKDVKKHLEDFVFEIIMKLVLLIITLFFPVLPHFALNNFVFPRIHLII